MAASSPRVLKRRQRTLDEIVRTALEVMDETGAAGLSLGEVAKRMGMRTPSLYGYVASKDALVDQLFALGWTRLAAVPGGAVAQAARVPADEVRELLHDGARSFVAWALENRALAEVMFWRPLPGWEPSPTAYEPAVATVTALAEVLTTLRDRGLLRPGVDVEEMVDVFVLVVTGVISQALANEPGAGVDASRFAARLRTLTDMLADAYLSDPLERPSPTDPSHRQDPA